MSKGLTLRQRGDSLFAIGGVKIPSQVVSAPLAGVTDKAFRLLARDHGCGLILTEMISDQALLYNQERTRAMINLLDEERPLSLQLVGSQTKYMGQAAARVCQLATPDIIDINMGCPTPKVVKNGEGAALMRDLSRARDIIRSVLDVATCPVTVKMRSGWDEDNINFLELAAIAEQEGIAALTLHPRTREQLFSGYAYWPHIGLLKQTVSIPVIGNGDIWEPEAAKQMINETGCDAVMIGRGSMGNPWIFQRITHLLTTGELLPPPTADEKITMAKRHYDLSIKYKGEDTALREMRKHTAWYIKGLKGAALAREAINRANTHAEVISILETLR